MPWQLEKGLSTDTGHRQETVNNVDPFAQPDNNRGRASTYTQKQQQQLKSSQTFSPC
jgi:hypothetical protein